MCGFAGFLGEYKGEVSEQDVLKNMGRQLQHRGPDDEGIWCDTSSGIGLIHERLSILDVSQEGHQPMVSASGRFIIAYNGEIYNYLEIRDDLIKQGSNFRGDSDTEVLIEAISHWGLEQALNRCSGMFAFALWDRQNRTLRLARDRIGEKPLYYGYINNVFLFGSELSSLKQHPSWQGNINRDALSSFLKFSYIPTPLSIYKNIYKLMPGAVLTVTQSSLKSSALPQPEPFWSLQQLVDQQKQAVSKCNEDDILSGLEGVLRKTIRQTMIADVPVGAFLSGGVDSSLISALMQMESNTSINTFTIGFKDKAYNEAGYAKQIARHLGTKHYEHYVDSKDALDVVPELCNIYSEPFADASQIPTYLISKIAKQNVSVILSGDGGDEVFGGYNRYTWIPRLLSKTKWLPQPFLNLLASTIHTISPERLDKLASAFSKLIPGNTAIKRPGEKLHKLAWMCKAGNAEDMYMRAVSQWYSPDKLVVNSRHYDPVLQYINNLPDEMDLTSKMMFTDMRNYLVDDILVKVDRASMAVSLETRTPYIDSRVLNYMSTVPASMKISGGQSKYLLRKLLYKLVPEKLIERPKMGFAVPISEWLRGSLTDWAEDLLDPVRMRDEGFLDVGLVQKTWNRHKKSKDNLQYKLWPILMFQSWLRGHTHQAQQVL